MLEGMNQIPETIKALKCHPEDLYNWDETGPFYKSLPGTTLAGPQDSGAGCKKDREELQL
jgi:hypothetical protein